MRHGGGTSFTCEDTRRDDPPSPRPVSEFRSFSAYSIYIYPRLPRPKAWKPGWSP